MTEQLPQKYQEVARALIPYIPPDRYDQIAMIHIDPALPCSICGQPAPAALVAPAPDRPPTAPTAWLTFPICRDCEKRQVRSQAGG